MLRQTVPKQLNQILGRMRHQAICWLIAILCLASFSFQDYVLQTHDHLQKSGYPQNAVYTAGHISISDGVGGNVNYGDEAQCHYCRVISQAGSFLAAAQFTFDPCAAQAAAVRPRYLARCIASYPSHFWDSRGPPQA
jgi:hypothetical protein